MTALRLASGMRLGLLFAFVGCVPGELVLEAPGEGGADSTDARADALGGGCPTPADCSKAACRAQGYVCTPPPPTGGSLVAVDFTRDVPCPPDYGTSYPVVTLPTGGPATCGCTCAPGVSPSCVVGKIDISVGTTTCTSPSTWDANDGGCMASTATVAGSCQVTSTPPATGGTCIGKATTTVPSSGSSSSYVCPWSGTPSTTGCSGGELCVAVRSTQSQCVIEMGSVKCPVAYPVSHAVGTSVTDTRACSGACSCAAPLAKCKDPVWTYYTAAACVGTPFSVDMNGSCDAQTWSGGSLLSYQYSATPTGITCGAATAVPTPSGSLALAGPQTLCCLP